MNYLREAGTYLTNKHGLCNVGQWHSHHRMRLFKPSGGDENTVWRNMPRLGLNRFIVFIANITDRVTINCFLFQIKDGQQFSLKEGKIEDLKGDSPFRFNYDILDRIKPGAESLNGYRNKISASVYHGSHASKESRRDKNDNKNSNKMLTNQRDPQSQNKSNEHPGTNEQSVNNADGKEVITVENQERVEAGSDREEKGKKKSQRCCCWHCFRKTSPEPTLNDPNAIETVKENTEESKVDGEKKTSVSKKRNQKGCFKFCCFGKTNPEPGLNDPKAIGPAKDDSEESKLDGDKKMSDKVKSISQEDSGISDGRDDKSNADAKDMITVENRGHVNSYREEKEDKKTRRRYSINLTGKRGNYQVTTLV